MSASQLISEETVRQRVSNYIQSLGFDIDDIEHEVRTLPIKAFRNVQITIGPKNKQTAHGRIDILVRVDNKDPLFVVEVKRPDVNIDQGKEQAIAYARLLLAPLVVITNGTDTKLFDPLTTNGDEINTVSESAYAKNSFKVNISEDIKSHALSYFIGYNLENLVTFCESQRTNRMSFLKGDTSDSEKKYIPELFISPPNLESEFLKFLKNKDNKKVFLIHGESGSGKTNAMCFLSDIIGKEYPSLFFAASVLGRDIREEMEIDFNYNFSSERSVISIIKRISEILEKYDAKLIIFIDAIDEYQIQNASIVITEFFNEIRNFDKIYLCVSAKTTRINDFLYLNGIPTIATSYQDFVCNRLDDDALKKILENYGKFYSTRGNAIGQIKEECRLPLFTRVLHEVHSGSDIPTDLSKDDLIEKFLEKKLEKIPSSCHLTVHTLLTKMTSLMNEKKNPSLNISDVYGLLQQNIDSYLNSLLEHHVLVKEDSRVSFYFDRVRDYFLAFKVKQWQNMSPDNFEKEIQTVMSNPISQSSILWYSNVGPTPHQNIMINHVQLNALKFVEKYEYYLNTYFSKIKTLFEPNTNKNIGIVIFKNSNNSRINGYGFKPINPDQEKVKLIVVDVKSFWEYSGSPGTEGIRTLHGGGFDFVTIENAEPSSKSFIFRNLEQIIEHRGLFENENLLIERLLKIISDYPVQLGYGEFSETFWEKVFPIDLEHFKNYRLSHLALWAKHAIQIFDEKYRDKYPGTKDFGKNVPHNLKLMTSLMHGDYSEIKNRVDAELRGVFEARVTLSDIQIDSLFQMIDFLLSKRKIITEPILPFGDKGITSPRKGPWSAVEYTSIGMQNYLYQFFKTSLSEYRGLVETNFPILKNSLLSEYKFPCKVIAAYALPKGLHSGGVHYTIFPNEDGDSDEIEIYEEGVNSPFDITEPFTVITKSGTKRINWLMRTVIQNFFEELTLQKWCYDTLKEEMKDAYAEIK